MAFVRSRGTQFTLDDRPFYFAGTNNYYLPYKSKFMVDAALNAAQTLGLQVIRTWGFLDADKEGVNFHSWNPITGTPEFNDGTAGLEHLDYVVDAARQRGLKLVLPLVNNWKDFGGVDQYLAWYSLNSHQDFFIDPRPRQAYKDWISHLVNRTNVLNRLVYKDDDTILAWELGNELRCPGNPAALLAWITEMSAFLKQIDPNHLIGVGDEGFLRRTGSPDWTYDGSQGTDFEGFLGIPTIDFGGFHLYPETWGKNGDFGDYWIKDHLDACARANKPALLEEYGLHDGPTRMAVYQRWLNQIYERNGAGDLVWMLAANQDDGTFYPNFDGFMLYENSFPEAIASHVVQMRDKTTNG